MPNRNHPTTIVLTTDATDFDTTYFLEMKHDVKLTDIAEILVKCLHKQMDELEVG